MRRDDDSAGATRPETEAPPRDRTELLRAVEQNEIRCADVSDAFPNRTQRELVALRAELQKNNFPPARFEPFGEIFEQRGFACATRANQRAAILLRLEAREKLRPFSFVEPVPLAQHAVNREGIVARAQHHEFGVSTISRPSGASMNSQRATSSSATSSTAQSSEISFPENEYGAAGSVNRNRSDEHTPE